MYQGLRQLKKSFDELGITYMLDCGTLLFAIRENRCEPFDIDVSIFSEDKQKLLAGIETFFNHGLKFNNIFFHPEYGLMVLSLLWKDWGVDVFVRYEKDDCSFFISLYGNEYLVAAHSKKFVEKLDNFTLDGITHKVPHNPQKYLTAYYGEWETPVPHDKWDRKMPKCIRTDLI